MMNSTKQVAFFSRDLEVRALEEDSFIDFTELILCGSHSSLAGTFVLPGVHRVQSALASRCGAWFCPALHIGNSALEVCSHSGQLFLF